tara:strand:- start:7973 stop:10669 length:2697 start_codon:yes stop_codon:yes gene_type:complete
MFAGKKKNYYFLFYLALLLILLVFFFIKTPGFKGGVDQEIRILTKNPIIIDGRKPIRESIPNIFIVLKNIFNFNQKNFETLKIDINYDNFDKLNQDRSKALKVGMLRNPIKVNADIFWQGKKINASARLKGDFNDHRNFNKQWSLKLNLRKSEHLDGMTEFSITNHRSRNFPYNFVISKNLERMGLIVPKYKTVKVIFNGYDWGLMLIEEHFTKEFLENRKLRNNLIFKLSNEEKMRFIHLYQYRDKIINQEDLTLLTQWQDKLNVYYHNEKKIIKQDFTDETKDFMKKLSLMKSLNETINFDKVNDNNELIEKHFDLKSFAKMFVSSLAWGESKFHSMELNNARFYINPYNLKVYPIPADYEFIFKMHNYKISNENIDQYLSTIIYDMIYMPPLYQSIFWNKKFQYLYLEALKEFEKNLPKIIKDTELICSEYNEICNNIVNLNRLKKNVSHLKTLNKKIFDEYMKVYPDYTNSQNEIHENYLKKINYNTIKNFNLYNNHLYARVFESGKLQITNLTQTNIQINSINIEKLNYKKKINKIINPSKYTTASTLNLNLNKKPEVNSLVTINYSFPSNESFKSYKTYVEIDVDLLDKNIDYFDFKKNNITIDKKNIIFKDKEYIIRKPIFIPNNYNLLIPAGAELKFSENSYIFSNYGSIKILGENNKKVYLTALDRSWKGIHIIGNKEKSIINYAKISKLNYFQNKKFTLTGGINFYESVVDINNSEFNISYSEDTINLINSKFIIKNSKFKMSNSDALDSDYSNGDIINTTFSDVGGDAIDTSGSNISIEKVKIKNIGDKGISVGENSNVKATNVSINNSNIGIASKDSSKFFGNNLLIKNSRKYDLASYNKKKVFKGGNMEIKKIISDDKYLVQKESNIIIEQKKINEKNFNTKDLY